MDWKDFLVNVAKVGVAVAEHSQFIDFVKLDRSAATSYISSVVASMHPTQLDQFEADFLNHCTAIIDAAQRRRAFELYAWLKVQETLRYGQFRGFIGSGNPIW